MAKRGRKEKDNWKKKRRQEYLEKKNSATIFSAKDKQRNLNIFKDSNGILKIIPFIEIWF